MSEAAERVPTSAQGPAAGSAAPVPAGGLRPIGHYLIALVALAVVPMMVIAAVLIARQATLQRGDVERSLQQTASALSVAVDRELYGFEVMLEALAQSTLLDRGDFAEFQALAARVIADQGGVFISLFDREGRQIFNTLRPPGTTLPTPFRQRLPAPGEDAPPIGETASLKTVLATGQPANSDLFTGLVAGRLLFTVNVPVVREREVRYVLNAAFPPDTVSGLFNQHEQFRELRALIVDRQGFIVGRSRDQDRFVGRRAPREVLERLRTSPYGITPATDLDGEAVLFAFARSPGSGWGAILKVEPARVAQEVRADWILGGAVAAGGVAVGLGFALALAGRLRRPLEALARTAGGHRPPALLEGTRIREIRLLERALLDAAEVREAEARERESRLVAEAREAEAHAASRAKDEFIATLAHELRNPLAAIASAVHVMNLTGEAGSAQPRGIVSRQVDHLARLVDDVLDVARITSGRVVLHRQVVDLAKTVDQSVAMLQAADRGRRHQVSVTTVSAPVSADPARLEQIVTNLLDNAVKYTPPGGRVDVAVTREGPEAVLRVRDTGVGISPELLPRVFDLFVQADRSLDRARGGLGLGLTLVRRLVGLHGGRVEARSDGPGRGSEFLVALPLAAAAPAAAEEAPRPPDSSRPRRILVIEDHEDARESLRLWLGLEGHEVTMAADGAEGLAALRRERPDLALVDVGLPALDGYAVARAAREDPALAGTALVALTGYGRPEDRRRALEAGFVAHLVKPVTREALGRVLATLDGEGAPAAGPPGAVTG
jgi:signal transduction histidine kinase/ActR/RegA family two-component response regulator